MQNNITIIEKPSIDMVKGFYSNGVHCGLKKKEMLDLGMVISDVLAKTYAVYTVNKVKGAPLYVCKEHLKDNRAQALVVNSKIANTCTGEKGIKDSIKICEEIAKIFSLNTENVIPMSTGVIGEHLPTDKIIDGINNLSKVIKEKNENNFAKAIMTTDTYPKIKGVKVKDSIGEYSIVGVAKGSGMIHPNMATMLSFIFTDAKISGKLLKKVFKNSIKKSFNSISVDGDTSTNDTVIIFANELAGNKKINRKKSEEFKTFADALDYITISLAKEIVKDGEGATKFVEINIKNARTKKEAKKGCTAIAKSSLVKTAFFGEDPNWGRIICALGYSGINFDPAETELYFDNLLLYKNGEKTNFSEEDAKKILQNNEIKVNIDLKSGNKKWTAWTSDLTTDYIKINANYRT